MRTLFKQSIVLIFSLFGVKVNIVKKKKQLHHIYIFFKIMFVTSIIEYHLLISYLQIIIFGTVPHAILL